ncbi:hypothetical protein [Vibrio sagamiensis]|uniref:Up-regulated in Daf-2 domain-containing protein n=1 Tax=Vibrio sagamiensis NBRC 104589 TaxID=1219064 RepID=A0A511QJU6_9VIBR|nr:hypothetical protein [Vibrio sagamiensis]PNQ66316.1 hypothetical protein C1141_08735 [Vibrio agarivorans]GEM77551.1 hypothetical protein VSA01S_36630 [Vibrio sagamiensis NBRC 104589]
MTKRTAKAQIVNETGRAIKVATLNHKYSDNYKNHKTFGSIPDGEASDFLSVEYNTGFGTTGRDWWLATWQYDEKEVFFTNPNNFRAAFDWAEGQVNSLFASVKDIPDELTPAVNIASKAFNSESTKGFKQHILRSEDSGKVVKITLKKDGKVVITSPSGKSETVYSSKEIKK